MASDQGLHYLCFIQQFSDTSTGSTFDLFRLLGKELKVSQYVISAIDKVLNNLVFFSFFYPLISH